MEQRGSRPVIIMIHRESQGVYMDPRPHSRQRAEGREGVGEGGARRAFSTLKNTNKTRKKGHSLSPER